MLAETLTKHLYKVADKKALAQAYILSGPDINPKNKIAISLALYLNCSNETKPCGICLNCKWISTNSHPKNPLYLRPKEDSKKQVITVADCEELQNALSKSDETYRVVIIEDATTNCFKADTANKLLKTLEEPPANTVFFLFAPDTELVLRTIVSRAQEIYVDPEPSKQAPLNEAAQTLYDKYSSLLLNAGQLSPKTYKLDLMLAATEIASAEKETILELLETLSDDFSAMLKSNPELASSKVEAIETIKNDVRAFVKADMAIYHALK